MSKVSVLMPVYKTKEAYLREAIESVLNQTFTDFEFLILDDCPKDNREAVVKFYDDKRIKYVKNEKNLGISKSRNKLIDMAQGEYLAVFDHDDISLPMRFEKEVAYLDTHPEVGVVSCWVDYISDNSKGIHSLADDIEIKASLMDVCALVHSASMIRKSVLVKNNVHYEEEFSPAEDYCLWLRLIPFTQFHNLQEVLLEYRQDRGNTTSRQFSRMIAATRKLQLMARAQHPSLFQAYLARRTVISHIKLLGIPFMVIKASPQKVRCYLFGRIPLLKISRDFLLLQTK